MRPIYRKNPKPYKEDPNLDAAKLEHNIKYYTDVRLIGLGAELDDNLIEIKENLDEFGEDMAMFFQENYFARLYYQSLNENYFWEYCPFDVYKNTFQGRLIKYLDNSLDSTNRDFYISELLEIAVIENEFEIKYSNFDFTNFFCQPKNIRISGTSGATMFDYKKPFYSPVIETTQKRKIEFLIRLLNGEVHQGFKNEIESNSFPSIFQKYGYKLFCYLDENYTRDNKSLKAKYSNIFRFLVYEELIIGTQQDYIDFISSEYKVKLSKIFPENKAKFTDKIKPELTQLRQNFMSKK